MLYAVDSLNQIQPIAGPAMHIPDGFLSLPVSLVGWAISIAMLAYATRLTGRQLGEKQVPLMGVMAAFIFAAQMLNFTVAGGTSGHLIGGALAAILLGPWAGTLIMTAVVAVQALLFQDGGLVVMGANILNMGIIACFVGYYAYTWLTPIVGQRSWGMLARAFVAAWLSVVISAIATAIELGLSGTIPLTVALPTMGTVHVLIGIGEGVITAATLAFILAARRDLLEMSTL